MEYLHKEDGNCKRYCFYWVINPGDQTLWTPKQHSTLSEKSLTVRKVGNKCSTIPNVEEEEAKNPEAIPLAIAKQVKNNPWDSKQYSIIFGLIPHESIEVTICNMIDVLEKGLHAKVKEIILECTSENVFLLTEHAHA